MRIKNKNKKKRKEKEKLNLAGGGGNRQLFSRCRVSVLRDEKVLGTGCAATYMYLTLLNCILRSDLDGEFDVMCTLPRLKTKVNNNVNLHIERKNRFKMTNAENGLDKIFHLQGKERLIGKGEKGIKYKLPVVQ